MVVRCPIIVTCQTKILIKEQSLTYNADGKATETYDEIIRRGMKELEKQRTNKIDVSKL